MEVLARHLYVNLAKHGDVQTCACVLSFQSSRHEAHHTWLAKEVVIILYFVTSYLYVLVPSFVRSSSSLDRSYGSPWCCKDITHQSRAMSLYDVVL